MARLRIKKGDIDFKYNFKLYFSFIKKYKLLLFFIIFLVFLSEIKHVADKFLFKIVIDNGANFVGGSITKTIFINSLMVILFIYVSLSLTHLFTYWLRIHLLNRLEAKSIANMKRKFFNHILNLDHDFHTSHKTGSMISRLLRGAGSMERMTDIMVLNFSALILQATIAFITILYFDVTSAITIVVIITSFIFYSLFIQRLQEKSSLMAVSSEDKEKGNISDFFTNIDSIKYYGRESIIGRKYFQLSEESKKNHIKNWDYFRWLAFGQNLILIFGTFAIIYFPLIKLLNGQITIGTLAFIYTTYLGMTGYMYMFVNGIRGFYRSMADFQDLFEYNKKTNKIKNKPNAKNLKIKKGTMEFKNVEFAYGKRKILKNFNLKIKENEKIALVGHSGSGKTTLIKLLNRFYDVNSGEILIDGKNIKEVRQESLRAETGIVPQECILFDDTIYNNIKFVMPNASREQIMDAMRFAQLEKIIEYLPDKEKTIVGERGVKLSGGEKQRVSIARAILANKKILILDEATSALDSETEHQIQKSLKKLLEGRTSIIIAHRLSTIMNADRIIVMKNGKIIQEGKHHNLINKPGEYKKLWNLQKGGYIK